jgi:hypothetical protein
MLSFDDTQLDRLYAAAELVPQPRRDNFLKSVANILGGLHHDPSTADVEHAIAFVLNGYGIIGGRSFVTHHTKRAARRHQQQQHRLGFV